MFQPQTLIAGMLLAFALTFTALLSAMTVRSHKMGMYWTVTCLVIFSMLFVAALKDAISQPIIEPVTAAARH